MTGSGEIVAEAGEGAINQVAEGGAVGAGHPVPMAGCPFVAVGCPGEEASKLEVRLVRCEEPM